MDLSRFAGRTVRLVLEADAERTGTVALFGSPTLYTPSEPAQNPQVPWPTGEVEVVSGAVPCDGEGCEIQVTCANVAAPARAIVKVGMPTEVPARGTDGPGAVLPPNVTMLYAVEAPSKGGDTLFASSVAAYQTLSPELKHTLSGLQVVNSFDHHNDKVATFGGTNVLPRVQQLRVGNPDKIEKLVQIHPVTGEQHLFVTHQMVKQVIGLEDSEGMDLVMQLVDHMTQPQLVYRHHWSAGDLIVFDNRSTIHSATAYDYHDERRLMYQIIIGERPGSSEPRTNVN